MDQLLGSVSGLLSGSNINAAIAALNIVAGNVTIESLFESLIEGLKNFAQFLFTSLDALN